MALLRINQNIIKNATSVYGIPLSRFFPNNTAFAILEARILHKYEGSIKTDEILGASYLLADLDSGSQFTVRVDAPTLVVTQQQIDACQETFFAELPLDDTVVSPYEISFGNAKVSIRAPRIKLVKN